MKRRYLLFNLLVIAVLGVLALFAHGCGDDAGGGYYSGSGEFGATQGGVQDMTLARSLVEQGQVPPADAFVVEAMFSEHDLPLQGAPCQTTLCLRAALGVAPDAAGQPAAWLQIGMSSTIDPATFVRPSQALVAVVDVSGSMGWDYGSTTPGGLARQLLRDIVDQLGPDDLMAIVAFGSVARVEMQLVTGDQHDRIDRHIDALHEDGSTDLESGLRAALPIARAALGRTDEVRILILSDYQPNVGATQPSEFQDLVSLAAVDGIGTTLFGLGLGLGPDLMKAMSEIRGANAFSAMDADDVELLMEDSWPWMVCPLAYDLELSLSLAHGLTMAAAYGFPGVAGDAESALSVATVFLSRRRGGMLVQLRPPDDASTITTAGAQLKLGYVPRQGGAVQQPLGAQYDGQPTDEAGRYLPQIGLAKAVALALLVSGMQEAAERYATDPAQAEAILGRALDRFNADADAIADPALDRERDFGLALLRLMQQRAPQGNLYGGY